MICFLVTDTEGRWCRVLRVRSCIGAGRTAHVYDRQWHCAKETSEAHAQSPGMYGRTCLQLSAYCLLWSPYVIGQTIIFLPCDFFVLLSFSFFPRLISAAVDWMSTILPHMVWP